MIITILTAGSLGDVQPYVALGAGLKRAGHIVRIPAPEIYRDLIIHAGLEFEPTHSFSPQDFLNRPDIQALAQQGNQLKVLATLLRESGPMMKGMLAEFWDACQDTQLVITSGALFSASAGAEKLGIPWIPTMPAPLYPTRHFPAPFLSNGPSFGGAYNRMTHQLFQQILWQMSRPSINHQRKNLGLAPLPFFDPHRQIRQLRIPFLFGISPSVIPKPSDWPKTHHVTGYWFLDQTDTWQPPAELVKFLDEGPPPVCIGFGSMDSQNPEKITRLAIDALKISGQRGILLSGWSGTDSLDLPENIYQAQSIPHDWLFPRVAAVVHHGGAGTTAAGLRAGKPSLITPFGGDQFFWQKIIVGLGVGLKTPAFKRLTAETLGQAIKMTLSDPHIQDQASVLGAKIQAEDGIAQAVNIIHQYINYPINI